MARTSDTCEDARRGRRRISGTMGLMNDESVIVSREGAVVAIALNDPDRRNALGVAMFDALDTALKALVADDETRVVLLRGEGRAFCAGFDLAAAVEDSSLMGTYIERLSGVTRRLRRLPQVVVAAVQGAAIAGGCALLSACDFVVMAADAKAGYPVHQLGVTPAVTIPTLQQAIGAGPARALLLGGALLDGAAAHRIGLATHLAASTESVRDEAMDVCRMLAAKPPGGLRATKAWLNELDGSLDGRRFEGPARSSAAAAGSDEARRMLARFVKRLMP